MYSDCDKNDIISGGRFALARICLACGSRCPNSSSNRTYPNSLFRTCNFSVGCRAPPEHLYAYTRAAKREDSRYQELGRPPEGAGRYR